MDKYWYNHSGFYNYPFKKGYLRVHEETEKFMLSLGYKHDNDNNRYIPVRPNNDRIALFAHQGFGLTFLSCLLDIPLPQITNNFDMSHSNVTTIYFDDSRDYVIPKVFQLSNDSHIFSDGICTKYNNYMEF